MKCTILNRNYPPNAGITGHSANELSAYLIERGVDVHIVTVGGQYAGGGATRDDVNGTVHRLKGIYDGKKKAFRLLSSLWEGRAMARKAASLGCGPIICMTDPPLLNFWTARTCRARRLPWLYWSMDLYPEAFVAGGLTSPDNAVYRFFKRGALASKPSHLLALGPRQGEVIQRDYTEVASQTILPCGIAQASASGEPPDWTSDDKIVFGYAGNLGEAHSDEFLRAFMEVLDPERHRLVLAPYGSKAAGVKDFAKNRPGVVLVDSVARSHLRYVDVHLVTLLPHWNHVCVPSKAVSAVCEGGAILFHGTEDNDNWQLLNEAGWRLDPGSELPGQLAAFIQTLTPETLQEKKQRAAEVARNLQVMKERAFEEIYSRVAALQ